jgi:N-acetylmuramoyl-L-alanine amidase
MQKRRQVAALNLRQMNQLLKIVIIIALAVGCGSCRAVSVKEPVKETPAPVKTPAARQKAVCIDPGHPSEVNSGSTIQNGTTEVHIAWVVALRLKQILEDQGFKVTMTKSREGELVKNVDRAAIGNSSGAELMVRLHCDAGNDEGFAVYAPDRQATKENTTGPPQAVIDKSKILADAIDREMSKSLTRDLKNGGVRGDSQTAVGSQQGALTVSIFSRIPIVTIEMVVLSNKADAEFIKSEAGQQKMARAVADGIAQFVATDGK